MLLHHAEVLESFRLDVRCFFSAKENLLCGMGSLGTFVIGIVFHPKLIQVFVALQRNAIEGKFSNNSRKLSFSIWVMTGVNSSRQR